MIALATVICLIILGLIAGSFVNALVWRLSKALDSEGNPLPKKDIPKKYSIIWGHSMCPHCHHKLVAKDLVPVLSWASLVGKCRYCNRPISVQYPIVELLVAALFVLSYSFWPIELVGFEWIVFIGYLFATVMLVALGLYDFKHKILPSRLIYLGIFTYAGALMLYSLFSGDFSRSGLAFVAGSMFFTIFLTIFVASYINKQYGHGKQDWLGFGDVRLVFLLGLILGNPLLVLISIFFASVIGILFSLPALVNKDITMASKIPFGPFLIAATFITFWWGNILLDWYLINILGL